VSVVPGCSEAPAISVGPTPPATGQLPSQAAVMAQAAAENFPVASWLLGPRVRRHLLALYGFARLVDDVGDEAPADRLGLLAQIERELDVPTHPVMCSLARTVSECALPRDPFLRLIEANRRDQQITRYESPEQLREYCQLSAAPVGELVLMVMGAASPERIALSDRVCAALQVIEHLQDVEEDAARGRRYIGDWDAVAQARELLAAAPPLIRSLRGRARMAVAGFVAGGRIALDRLAGDLPAAPGSGRPVAGRARAGRPHSRARFLRAYLTALAGR
jgi:phytoene/squalene synthetase